MLKVLLKLSTFTADDRTELPHLKNNQYTINQFWFFFSFIIIRKRKEIYLNTINDKLEQK